MNGARKLVSYVLAIAVAGLACAATINLLPGSTPARAAAMAEPPGRGLETPWWERITVIPPVHHGTTTYVVPADVLFSTNSATIDDAGRDQLIGLAHTTLTPARKVVIAGATDSRGTRTTNLQLSEARANAARSILIKAGIKPRIIETEKWADDHPVADELGPDPATAQARNRRIEIIVTT